MRIAVMGAGGGGLALAYEWASQGHEVALYAQQAHEDHLVPVRERGGIEAEGMLEGYAALDDGHHRHRRGVGRCGRGFCRRPCLCHGAARP